MSAEKIESEKEESETVLEQEALNENENNDENQEYEREDSETGYAKNLTEATMLKASRKYEVIANKLMGSFDDKGHYTIPKEILTELTLFKKLVGVKNENGTELKAFYKDFIFEFLLKFNGVNKEKTEESATLFLIERIEKVNGYIINKMLTPVATYSAMPSENFQTFCYEAFHVVKNIDDESVGALGGDAQNIDKRIAYLLAVREVSKNAYIEIEELYFNARLSILDSIPQGTLILSEFAKKRALLEKYFIGSDRNKFRALNELLTSILEANPKIMEQMPVFDVMITPLNNKYLEATIAISQKIKLSDKYKALENAPTAVASPTPVGGGAVKVETGGKKPAPKPSAPKKSGGGGKKKSGGGGGGKGGGGKKKSGGGDKKKDDKKKKGPKGPGLYVPKKIPEPKKTPEQKKEPPKLELKKAETLNPQKKEEQKKPAKQKEPEPEPEILKDFEDFDEFGGLGADVKPQSIDKEKTDFVDQDKQSKGGTDVKQQGENKSDLGFDDLDDLGAIPNPMKQKVLEKERGLS